MRYGVDLPFAKSLNLGGGLLGRRRRVRRRGKIRNCPKLSEPVAAEEFLAERVKAINELGLGTEELDAVLFAGRDAKDVAGFQTFTLLALAEENNFSLCNKGRLLMDVLVEGFRFTPGAVGKCHDGHHNLFPVNNGSRHPGFHRYQGRIARLQYRHSEIA